MINLRAKDIMTKDVLWIPEDMTVGEATDLFVGEMISGAPVVDANNNMTGVVSIRDFLKNGEVSERFSADDDRNTVYYNESWELPLSREEATAFHMEVQREAIVKDIMTPIVFNADMETPVVELAQTMLKGRIHRVIILDGDELAGMVTSMDMLKVVAELT
jgi:CBS-domain-containing membrane protein